MMQSEMYDSTPESSISKEPPIPSSATLLQPTSSLESESEFDPNVDYLEKPKSRGHASPVFVNPRGNFDSSDLSNSSTSTGSSSSFFSRLSFYDSQTSIGVSPFLLSAVGYFFCWLGALVLIRFETKNVFVIFNAWQALITGTFTFFVQLLFFWSDSMYTLLWIIYLIWEFGMIALVISRAPSQRLLKMPVIGEWCERKAINTVQQSSDASLSYQRMV